MVHVLSVSADETAHRVAADAVAGRIPAVEARNRIAELVVDSRIPAQVAARAGTAGQQHIDLVQGLRDRVLRLLLEDDEFFCIERLVDGSFDGWLRKTATSMLLSEPAYRPRGMAARTTYVGLFDGLRAGLTAEREWLAMVEGPTPEEAVLEALAAGRESELVEIARRTKGRRPESLRFATASAIRVVLGLPSLCVPSTPEDRESVLAACAADPLLADRARRSTIESLREGGSPSRVDERLLALWDDMSVEQMARLDPYPPAATHVLVVGTLEPMPKPPRAVVRATRRALREAGGHSMAWVNTSQQLLEGWLARWCRPVSDFDDTNDAATKAAMRAAAETAAATWPAVVETVCSWPGSPLGTTPEEVEQTISETYLRALEEDEARRTAV